jgi:probable rRNA maturation factor
MIYLEIDEEFPQKVDQAKLTRAAGTALEHSGKSPEADLTLVITGDDRVQQLNRAYLGVDAPTDVLSFPDGSIDPDTGQPYLGDILISFPRAEAQARAGGHTILEEMQLLVVHGVLHLLGHDHAEPGEKERMWALQSKILSALGISIDIPAE